MTFNVSKPWKPPTYEVVERRCTKCLQIRPITDFYLRRDIGAEYRNTHCKHCVMNYIRGWHRRNPGLQKQWNHRICLRRRNLIPEQYEALLLSQGRACAICGSDKIAHSKSRLTVDHDHKTGANRGILCGNCNSGLGHFKDNRALLLKAVAYLEKWNA